MPSCCKGRAKPTRPQKIGSGAPAARRGAEAPPGKPVTIAAASRRLRASA